MMTFQNLPKRKKENKNKETVWNLAREGGWSKYMEESNKQSIVLAKIVDDEEKSVEEIMDKFNKIHEQIKYKAFGKVTIKDKRKVNTIQNSDSKEDTEEQRTQKLAEEQESRAEEEIEKIRKAAPSKVGKIWAARKEILNVNKNKLMATAIRNPVTNKLAVTQQEVKELTLNYCMETLKNNEPDDEFKEEMDAQNKVVAEFMKNKEGEFEASKETFMANVHKFKKSGKQSYDFLTKSGEKFQNVVFQLCQRMIREEKFPAVFFLSILV